jgi:hypothetical protein
MVSNLSHGVCYSPTWTTYRPPYNNEGPQAQFSDADFANISFQALWNFGGNLRNDLGTLGSASFNLVRLYNWGPTRGWNGLRGDAHMPFLDYATKQGLRVIVPISNYFLSNAEYAWNGRVPDAAYSFGSAPPAIQAALTNFISSATPPNTSRLHAAVHSFMVGNEIDLNDLKIHGGDPVEPTVRLARTLWWIVNLQGRLAARGDRTSLAANIANGDQGGGTILTTWFQAFVNGVQQGQLYPNGTNPGGPTKAFTGAWKGVGGLDWYTSWYYNCANIYQDGDGLIGTVRQYDDWKPGSNNHTNWPGQKFTVPLLLGEVGWRRDGNNENQQFDKVVNGVADPLEKYAKSRSTTRLAGYCIYSFNDETDIAANWGMFKTVVGTSPDMPTGVTRVSYAVWPSINLPVNTLLPVTSSGGIRLIDALKKIFTS